MIPLRLIILLLILMTPGLLAQSQDTSAPVPRCIVSGYHWLAPEDFKTPGGWDIDTQFIDQVGSSYLLATGVLDPVEDAEATLMLKRAGRYRVWVRTRDWLPKYHPGTYQVLINGEALTTVLGHAENDDWHWSIAGDVVLESGTVRVALHDLTGGFGRCAAVLLTTDTNYTPPPEADGVMRERARITGIDWAPRALGHFQVVVVGGGSSGCPAAIAAARLGARTALIQDRPVLGGNASSELGVPLEGAAVLQREARETGIVEEASRLQAQGNNAKVSEPFRILTAAEPNLTVFLNTRINSVEMAAASRIAAVLGVDVRDGSRVRASADYVIDCTGDGWVGYYAGAQYRLGREARWEFNEQDAPEQPDRITMSGCIMGGKGLCFWAQDTEKPVGYTPPPWAASIPNLLSIKRTPKLLFTGEWRLEHPGDRDDLFNAEKSRDELIRISFGYWDYVKNRWPERQRVATYALTDVPYRLAKRETRRLVGDYILTQNDILNGTRFADVVAYAGWPLDIHNPAGIYGGPEGPYATNHTFQGIRDLPFRCLFSVNIDNLLFAGRCASVTHLSLGTVRVQRTLATLGQAAGTAAALCSAHGCDPRMIATDHISELQQTLLKYDQYVPRIPNEDPTDLARGAKVTASSIATGVRLTGEKIRRSQKYHDMARHHRAMLLPIMHGQGVDSASLLLRSERSEPATVRLHIGEAGSADDFSATPDLAVAEAKLPADSEQWVTFQLDARPNSDYAWIWLEAVQGVAWRLTERPFMQARRAYAAADADGPAAWVLRSENYACRLIPPAEVRQNFSPENVINGWSRPIGEAPNMWRSDPDQPLPQWMEFTFPNPVEINTVHVSFGTEINGRYVDKKIDPDTGQAVVPGVCNYQIEAFDGMAWQTLVRETGNFQRWRRHQFDEVVANILRLTVHDTAAMDAVQVSEIRAYKE